MADNSTEFAREYKAASRADRGRVITSYKDWVFEGARAQGPWAFAFVLLGGSMFAVFLGWLDGSRSPIYFGVSAAGVLVGAIACRVAMKREREWRKTNPWQGPSKVR